MKKIHFILLLLSTVFSYSQVNLNVAIEDKEFKVNQKFALTFILEIQGNAVQQTPFRLPDFSKFERIANGSERNSIFLENIAVDQFIFQQVLIPKVAGEIKIGSAVVTVNGKIYKTEPFEIYVQPADRNVVAESAVKVKRNDVYLNVEVADTEVYQNEPVVAVLRAYSKNISNFRKVKNVQLPNQNDVEFSAVSYKESDIEYSKNGPSSQILAVFLVFPKKSGNLQMQPTTASFASIPHKLISNKISLKVKDLPANAPNEYKNAVGDFKVNLTTNSTKKIEVNKPINLRLTVSGEGNMENLILPTIKKSSDYEVFQPKISKKLKIGENGINGEIFADYILVPKKAGELSILTDEFSYFNPKDRDYTDLGAQEVILNVASLEEILSDRTPLERVNAYTNNVLETVDNPVITTKKLKVEPKNTLDWSTSVFNLILFIGIIGILILISNHQKTKKNSKNTLVNKKRFSTPFEVEKISDHDLENIIGNIRRMMREKNFDAVFGSIKELDQMVQNAYHSNSSSSFADVLEKIKGSKISEEYRVLSQKIQIEKYAPIKNEEHLNELVEISILFYSKIAK